MHTSPSLRQSVLFLLKKKPFLLVCAIFFTIMGFVLLAVPASFSDNDLEKNAVFYGLGTAMLFAALVLIKKTSFYAAEYAQSFRQEGAMQSDKPASLTKKKTPKTDLPKTRSMRRRGL